jgi:hypothetical protein
VHRRNGVALMLWEVLEAFVEYKKVTGSWLDFDFLDYQSWDRSFLTDTLIYLEAFSRLLGIQ